MRFSLIALAVSFTVMIGIAPTRAESCSPVESASEPPESAGCAVRPGVGALTSLAMSVIALGVASRRRSGRSR